MSIALHVAITTKDGCLTRFMPSQKRSQHSPEVPRAASQFTPAHPETQMVEVWEREEEFNTYVAKILNVAEMILGDFFQGSQEKNVSKLMIGAAEMSG